MSGDSPPITGVAPLTAARAIWRSPELPSVGTHYTPVAEPGSNNFRIASSGTVRPFGDSSQVIDYALIFGCDEFVFEVQSC